ncbi:hypothetical protein PF002_g20326 [Phytophthora fragariae]|uniref:FAR1 domain-containing protein n=1 Tax=Phytophthora fragariae TaxID=53985 RepID=A0A6A3XU06_9STRA|nr:hypothetical protein PF009_g19986 [Phytophthora fragariae]KAE9120952.1 hypothetical protein PF006_g18015 [Phytophthora fragariae]KAE9205436.1 hypothetical protein PF002_g20326 [Phytophthora fragariae]KAE9293086.1 hypothetical protein PF001_g18421 [Phytophthora fragariae]
MDAVRSYNMLRVSEKTLWPPQREAERTISSRTPPPNYQAQWQGILLLTATNPASTETYQETWELRCLPEGTFRSPQAVKQALNTFARAEGYGVVHKSTYKDKHDELRCVVYGCDRHGEKRTHHLHPQKDRRRNVASQKCGCRMEVSVVRVQGRDGEAVWALKHRERSTPPPVAQPSIAPCSSPQSHDDRAACVHSDGQ